MSTSTHPASTIPGAPRPKKHASIAPEVNTVKTDQSSNGIGSAPMTESTSSTGSAVDPLTTLHPAAQAPATASADTPPESSEGDITDLIPIEMRQKRVYKALARRVDAWQVPSSLSRLEERRYKTIAMATRFTDVLSAAQRYVLGKFLIESKDKLRHGEFRSYVIDALGISTRTSARYMQVARTFTEPRQVVNLGFDLACRIAEANLPKGLAEQAINSDTAEDAEKLLSDWIELQNIRAAFHALPGNPDPIAVIGLDLARQFAADQVPLELRQLALDLKEPAKVQELADQLRQALADGHVGDGVVRAIKAVRGGPSTSSKRLLHISHLRQRLEALTKFDGVVLDESAQRLASSIEENILQLAQMVESKS